VPCPAGPGQRRRSPGRRPRRAARPCRPRRERRLSPLHGTAAAPHNAAVPLLEATTAPAVWRSDRCFRTRAANTARSAQSRPGRGSVRRRTATSSTLCPQQGLLQDHAEGPLNWYFITLAHCASTQAPHAADGGRDHHRRRREPGLRSMSDAERKSKLHSPVGNGRSVGIAPSRFGTAPSCCR